MNAFDELMPLLGALQDLRRGNQRAALITLTHTRGATFRDVGTRMLVREDGSRVCELSGGCPQHDIVTHAMDAMKSGQPRRVRYNADYGLDVLMEMGCGGDLDVLIEPVDGDSDLSYISALRECLSRRRGGWMATVFTHDGEVMPTRHAVWCGRDLLHDGIQDQAWMAVLAEALREPPERPASVTVEASGVACEVLLEPITPRPSLVVIGSSTAAQALLPLAGYLGWDACLVDFDAQRLDGIALPDGARAVHASPAALREAVSLDDATAVVVMTHHLQKDADYLAALQDVSVAYVGLLGARGRVARVLERAGLPGTGIHGPVGLDIGAESPAEIALAIVAEILAALRGRHGGPLRTQSGSGA